MFYLFMSRGKSKDGCTLDSLFTLDLLCERKTNFIKFYYKNLPYLFTLNL